MAFTLQLTKFTQLSSLKLNVYSNCTQHIQLRQQATVLVEHLPRLLQWVFLRMELQRQWLILDNQEQVTPNMQHFHLLNLRTSTELLTTKTSYHIYLLKFQLTTTMLLMKCMKIKTEVSDNATRVGRIPPVLISGILCKLTLQITWYILE